MMASSWSDLDEFQDRIWCPEEDSNLHDVTR
jgi:hypothetical protein